MNENLEWLDSRWHRDGRGIHAGDCMEIQFPDGTWETCRIESGNAGQRLFAHFNHHGLDINIRVDPNAYQPLPIRWPT